jgi:hypothetical protein
MKRLIALLLIASFLTPLTVHAQSTGGFGLRPKDPTQAYFRFTAQPGQVIQDTLVALNDSDSEVTLTLIVSRASTALTGGLAFDDAPPKEGEAGTWLAMAAASVPGEVVIPAHSGLELPFKIAVPENVRPGDYAFGFVAAPASESVPTSAGSGFQVRVVSQAALSVLITIPGGDESSPVVRDVSLVNEFGIERIAITIANIGDIGWQGQGTFTLKVASGEIVAEREFHVGYVLPGDSIPYPIALDTSLPADTYTAEVRLGDSGEPFVKTLTVADAPTVPAASVSTSQTVNSGTANEVADATATGASQFPADTSASDLLPLLLFVTGLVSMLGVGLYALINRRRTK